jgi:tetratricopeptide (TPR) repeat protein
MKKIIPLVSIFLLSAAALALAQNLSVDFLDGTVELKTASTWRPLSIGDQIGSDATIRLAKGSILELSNSSQRISIVKEGTYVLSTLIKPSSAGDKGLGATLAQKIRNLTTEKQGAGTVGGARGAQMGSPEDIQYVDESTMTRDSVNQMFAAGKYEDAIPVLQKAVTESSSRDEETEFYYMLAQAYYNTGKPAKAYSVIAKITVTPSASYYPDFIILKAQVLVDSLAYQDAISLLTPFIASKPKTPYAQIAYLLSAQSSRGLGDEKSAKDALSKGYALDPASETAALIATLQK